MAWMAPKTIKNDSVNKNIVFLVDKVEKLRKGPFFGFLGQIWPFLKMVKSKWDGPPKMNFNDKNPFLHTQKYIF